MLMMHSRRPSFSCRPDIPTITPAILHANGATYIAKKKSFPNKPTLCPPQMMKGENGQATVNDAATMLVVLKRCFPAGVSDGFIGSSTVAVMPSGVNTKTKECRLQKSTSPANSRP